MLADRRDEPGRTRTQVINRLHRLLLELLPGGAKRFLSARQARTLIATVRPRDLVGKTRCRLAAELVGDSSCQVPTRSCETRLILLNLRPATSAHSLPSEVKAIAAT